jgi:enoyl-CoA hydratase
MPDLIHERRGDVAWITFNRPDARNALTFAMYEELAKICEAANQDTGLRCIVIRGAGDKAFASGTDINQFRAFKTPQDSLDYEARIDRILTALEQVRVPTIAAIAGACTGGGGAIAACCDLPSASLSRLTALVGPAKVKDLIFTARLIEADEAMRIGLVHELVDDAAALEARAGELSKTVAGMAPLTLRAVKEGLRRLQNRMSREEAEDLILMCYMSEDFREGMDAFLNKRQPQWKGR